MIDEVARCLAKQLTKKNLLGWYASARGDDALLQRMWRVREEVNFLWRCECDAEHNSNPIWEPYCCVCKIFQSQSDPHLQQYGVRYRELEREFFMTHKEREHLSVENEKDRECERELQERFHEGSFLQRRWRAMRRRRQSSISSNSHFN